MATVRTVLAALLLLVVVAPAWPQAEWRTGSIGKGTALWQAEGRRLAYRGGADYGWAVSGESIRDGFVEVRFRPLRGRRDRAAGVIWRWRDTDNYYMARANALEHNVVAYKVVDGRRMDLKPVGASAGAYGVETRVASGAWHRLRVDFSGPEFAVQFDGTLLFTVRDETFLDAGQVGLWSKADSVTQFEEFRAGEKSPEGAVAAPSRQSRLERTEGNQRSNGESSQRMVSSRWAPVETMQNGTPISSSSRARYWRALAGKSTSFLAPVVGVIQPDSSS
jgi:hypothetical protein